MRAESGVSEERAETRDMSESQVIADSGQSAECNERAESLWS